MCVLFSDVSLQPRHVFVQFVEESAALKALAQNPPDYIMSKKLGMYNSNIFILITIIQLPGVKLIFIV